MTSTNLNDSKNQDDDLVSTTSSDEKNQVAKPAEESVTGLPETDSNLKSKNDAPDLEISVKDKLDQARLAMEGPERTLKREHAEIEDKVEQEKEKLEQELSLINKEKKRLEINWVVLDNKQNELKKLLAPIKTEEEKVELEEERLEGEEHTTSDVKKRQEIEKQRWAIQDQRKDLERKKWELENKILTTDEELQKNTQAYQKLLDQEESIRQKIDSLEYEIEIVTEQLKLQRISEQEEAEKRLIAEENKRREMEAKAEEQENERLKKEKTEQIQKEKEAEEKQKLEEEKVKQAEHLATLQAEQAKRAEIEIKRQNQIEKLKTETEKTIDESTIKPEPTVNPSEKSEIKTKANFDSSPGLIPEFKNVENKLDANSTEFKKRAEILETARKAASQFNEESDLITPQTKSTETIDLSGQKDPYQENLEALNNDTDQPEPISDTTNDIPSLREGETSSLPKLRTFKSDVTTNDIFTPDQIADAKKKFPWLN